MTGWWCCQCQAVRRLDIHGRCSCCASDAICAAVPPKSGDEEFLKSLGVCAEKETKRANAR
jgi:hypothetical protein